MNTKQFVRVAMLTALACVLTIVPKVPIGGGYVHFGDCIIYVAAMILGPIPGAIVGAIGHSLADFISGYPIFCIPTFIIKGIMGFAIGKIVYGHVDIKYFMLDGYLCLFIFFAGEISKDMLQQEKITKRIEWKLANGIKISSIVKENLLSLWIGTLILLFPLLLMISIRLPNLILLLSTYFLILSILYSAFINVLILWIRNMNWFKSIPIFATLLHILLVVLKCGIFMKTNNVWVLLLFSPVSIIVLTACGLCLMTKERIVSSYY